jgi:hypothetical protein
MQSFVTEVAQWTRQAQGVHLGARGRAGRRVMADDVSRRVMANDVKPPGTPFIQGVTTRGVVHAAWGMGLPCVCVMIVRALATSLVYRGIAGSRCPCPSALHCYLHRQLPVWDHSI